MTDVFCLAVIPARGGSKGVPNKNLRDFAGSSLIELAVQAAQQSELINDFIVTTDSPDIADLARSRGADIPFLRESELSGDEVPVKAVTRATALWYEANRGVRPDIVLTLQPTSPLRTAEHLDTAIRMLAESDAEGLIGVTEAEHSPYKMRLIRDGLCSPLFPDMVVDQRQDAPPAYRLNGIVYATRWQTLIDKRSLWGDRALPYVLPEDVSFNIDTELEFQFAEFCYLKKYGRQT
ncbi:MAG: acylneuraminate cytidylyltransferase family protein [Chromatiales bacterium]|jgi:CMP-N-acetylneuraminic acid synthetase